MSLNNLIKQYPSLWDTTNANFYSRLCKSRSTKEILFKWNSAHIPTLSLSELRKAIKAYKTKVAKTLKKDCPMLHQDEFEIVKKCCINLVKKHGRSVMLFDDRAFQDLINLIPMTQSQKQTINSEYIQKLVDDDELGDDTDMEFPMERTTDTAIDDDGDETRVSEIKSEVEAVPCTCGKDTDETMTKHTVECPASSEQTYWKFFEFSVDTATCRICNKTTPWPNISTLKEHLQNDHPSVNIIDDNTLLERTTETAIETPLQEIRCEIEVVPCTCGKDADETMTRHTVECPASSQQTYWKFFEVSLETATCRICNKTIPWTNISTLKEHLQNEHPSVDFIDDDEKFQKAPPLEHSSFKDIRMEEVYVLGNLSDLAVAAKRKRLKTEAPLNITGPISRENIAASLDRFQSLDCFGQYVASLMKLIPKDKCIKFQIQFVEQLLQEQAAAA